MRDRWQKCRRQKHEWKILISKREEKRLFDGRRSRWDNIKISLENGAWVWDWILLLQDEALWRKLVNMVPYFGVYVLINLLATSVPKRDQ